MLRGATQWQVAQDVVDFLVEERLAAGTRLNEMALARRLGVSRTPVRAVLDHLAEQGILGRRPNQGFFVQRRLERSEEAGIDPGSADRLYERLLLDILEGGLARTMSESALMRRYDVSRGELNAALRRMIREGLAEPAPGQGWKFVQFSGEIIQKGYRLRLLLEPEVILEPDYEVDEAALRALARAHGAVLRKLSDDTPWSDLFNLDARFHETLAAGSGNELVVETIQKQNRIRRLNEFLGYERLDRVRSSLREHLSILESLLEGDREWAAAQLRQHLHKSLKQSVDHYAQDIDDFRAGRRRFAARRPAL